METDGEGIAEPATHSGTAMQMSSVLRVLFVIRLGTRGDYLSAEGGVKANGANWRAVWRCATLA